MRKQNDLVDTAALTNRRILPVFKTLAIRFSRTASGFRQCYVTPNAGQGGAERHGHLS